MRTVWSNTTASGCLPAGKCIWTGPSGRWLLAMGRLTFFMQPVLYSQRSQESGQYPTLKEYIAEHFSLAPADILAKVVGGNAAELYDIQ